MSLPHLRAARIRAFILTEHVPTASLAVADRTGGYVGHLYGRLGGSAEWERRVRGEAVAGDRGRARGAACGGDRGGDYGQRERLHWGWGAEG